MLTGAVSLVPQFLYTTLLQGLHVLPEFLGVDEHEEQVAQRFAAVLDVGELLNHEAGSGFLRVVALSLLHVHALGFNRDRTLLRCKHLSRRGNGAMGFFSSGVPRERLTLYEPFNLALPEFKANPHLFYARLRAEEPVFTRLLMQEQGWLVTRYEDVATVLKDERFVKEAASAKTPQQMARQPWFRRLNVFKAMRRTMLATDPPDHTRLRALVNKAFTPRLIEQMRSRVQTLSDELIDRAVRHGRMDLIGDFALPLPTTIIAELLGVPPADRHKFHRWSNALIAISSNWGIIKAIPNFFGLKRYLSKIIRRRRAQPQDDLVSALAKAEEAGGQLSEEELLAMVVLLLVAGHETTVNLIGNGMLALLEHPDQLEKLRADPLLIRTALEELLRYGSPVEIATERYAREDVTIAGVTIPRGGLVLAVIGSANRDERQFTDPDKLDITRDPNKHLSFGLGNHFCLGASLARLEGQIAINTLLRRLPNLRLAVPRGALRWRRGLLLRGLESLPVAFGSG
jgi:cytochrome P450